MSCLECHSLYCSVKKLNLNPSALTFHWRAQRKSTSTLILTIILKYICVGKHNKWAIRSCCNNRRWCGAAHWQPYWLMHYGHTVEDMKLKRKRGVTEATLSDERLRPRVTMSCRSWLRGIYRHDRIITRGLGLVPPLVKLSFKFFFITDHQKH